MPSMMLRRHHRLRSDGQRYFKSCPLASVSEVFPTSPGWVWADEFTLATDARQPPEPAPSGIHTEQAQTDSACQSPDIGRREQRMLATQPLTAACNAPFITKGTCSSTLMSAVEPDDLGVESVLELAEASLQAQDFSP